MGYAYELLKTSGYPGLCTLVMCSASHAPGSIVVQTGSATISDVDISMDFCMHAVFDIQNPWSPQNM